MTTEQDAEQQVVRIQPQGTFDIGAASAALDTIRAFPGGVEFDLSGVESMDMGAIQMMLVVIASKRKSGLPVVVQDSAQGVLRSLLTLAGIPAQMAGLSVALSL